MNTPIMLTAEQFSQLATKDYIDKKFATKDDLKNFATKDDLKNFATKDDLKNFATKDDIKNLEGKLNLRFNQLDYKIESSFNHLDKRLDKVDETLAGRGKDINELSFFSGDHEIRIRKLEFRVL